MSHRHSYRLPRFAVFSVISADLGIAPISATAQAKPQAAGNASSAELQPFTAPDGSASAGVPSGWRVADATGTAITIKGPKGEIISLGGSFLAHDGAFQVGQKGPADAWMSMPSSAKLTDKFVMIFQQDAALGKKPTPQIQYVSATPLQVPPAFGQCGRFVINITSASTQTKAMGAFCSLPVDAGGFYKNFVMMGSADAAIAAEDASIVQAVFASYKVPPTWLQRKFAPYTTPPALRAPPQGSSAEIVKAYMEASNNQQRAIDQGFQCVDLGILDTPAYRTPRACGGRAPND